jgi:hypothetical protein
MWADLAPVLLAMMISPARTLAVIILLHTPRPKFTAVSYVMGMIAAMMVQGAALAVGMRLVGLTADERAAELATFIGALFVVGGIVLLTGAAKMATAEGGGQLASVLARLEQMGPGAAFKIGFGWIFASPKQWVFVLTAVAIVFEADLRPIGGVANYAVFSLLVQLAYFVIIGGFALAEERVGRVLDGVFGWIRAHLRPSAIGLFVFFGVLFLVKGFTSLSG